MITPELERAARAVKAIAWANHGSEPPNAYDDAEAIVRAVLHSLLPPTDEMVDAGMVEYTKDVAGADHLDLDESVTRVFAAMVERVLGEE